MRLPCPSLLTASLAILAAACGTKSPLSPWPVGGTPIGDGGVRDARPGGDARPDGPITLDGGSDAGAGTCRETDDRFPELLTTEALGWPALARIDDRILVVYTVVDERSGTETVRSLPLSSSGVWDGYTVWLGEGSGGTIAPIAFWGEGFLVVYRTPEGMIQPIAVDLMGEPTGDPGDPLDVNTDTRRPALSMTDSTIGLAWNGYGATLALVFESDAPGREPTPFTIVGRDPSAAPSSADRGVVRFATLDSSNAYLSWAQPPGELTERGTETPDFPGGPVAVRVVEDEDDSAVAVLYSAYSDDQAGLFVALGDDEWNWWFPSLDEPVDLGAAYDPIGQWLGLALASRNEVGFHVLFTAYSKQTGDAQNPWPEWPLSADPATDEPPRPAVIDTGVRAGEFLVAWTQPQDDGYALMLRTVLCQDRE